MRVELDVLIDRELWNFLEGLLNKVLYLTLLMFSLLTVDVRCMACCLTIVHPLTCTHVAIA